LSFDTDSFVDDATFHDDVNYLETLWRRTPIGNRDVPVIDMGAKNAAPLVFVPILEHLEFVYAHQLRSLSRSRRVILYRRNEIRNRRVGLAERAEELREVLDSLELEQVDLLGHGDAAMVLFEFALRYPQRCRSLIIIAQGADYQIAPHPFIWLLHDLFLRLPVEYVLPAWFLRRIVINYIMAHDHENNSAPALPRRLIEEQFTKIEQWPFVYKFSVLPIIHYFDIRSRISQLHMPVLLINRSDDTLSPETKTRWLAEHLPDCAGYHVVSGKERFFLYSRASAVTPLLETFLQSGNTRHGPVQRSIT
jgi:pimeloyl-ACP methyl ester carboxylesterase